MSLVGEGRHNASAILSRLDHFGDGGDAVPTSGIFCDVTVRIKEDVIVWSDFISWQVRGKNCAGGSAQPTSQTGTMFCACAEISSRNLKRQQCGVCAFRKTLLCSRNRNFVIEVKFWELFADTKLKKKKKLKM